MHIDRENSRGRFSMNGRLQPEEVVELAASALTAAYAERLRNVILNFEDVSLVRCMSVTECYHAGERLARVGRALHKVAIVGRQDCAEPHQFALTVARNRGLRVASFLSESEAIGWLAG